MTNTSLQTIIDDWELVVVAESVDDTKAVIFKPAPWPVNHLLAGAGSSYQLGLMVVVPHVPDRGIVVHHAIRRILSNGIATLMHKDATFKIPNSGTMSVNRTIDSLARQTFGAFKVFAIERLMQIKHVAASLEECLSVAAITKGAAYEPLKIDEALTAHGMVSPADKWPMYRKQANTPNSKLDLMNIISEYAQDQLDSSDALKLMAIAGDIFVTQGDLESRPAWQYYEIIDRSNIPYFMK